MSIDPDIANLATNTRNEVPTTKVDKIDEVRRCTGSLKDIEYDHIFSLIPEGDEENKEGSRNSNGTNHIMGISKLASQDWTFQNSQAKNLTSWIYRAN